MTRRSFRLAAVPLLLLSPPCLGCSSSGNKLYGSLSQLYDLSFNKVDIILQSMSDSATGDTAPNQVQIEYISNSSGYPAILTVDFSNIENVAGSTIDLTQLDSGQPRGVLQRANSVTTDFPLQRGTISFNQVPVLGAELSGSFFTTISNPAGYTLDGDFSATVSSP